MGDIVSTALHYYPDGFAQDVTSTGQRDWITKHAELSNFSIVECERLWKRFEQLGCDENGVMHVAAINQFPRFKEDILMRNLLLAMAGGEKVYFHTFLNAMFWVNNATVEQKCKAIFSFFNNGNALGRELFSKIMKRIYPSKDEQTLTRYVHIVYSALSPGAAGTHGELGFDDFMKICNRLSSDELADVLSFNVIPQDINEEAQQRFEPQWRNQPDGTSKRDMTDKALICEDSYDELATKLALTDDWIVIMRKLGFSDAQIGRVVNKYADEASQIRALFSSWKELQEEDATAGVMRSVLNTVHPELRGSVFGISQNRTQ